MKNKIQIIIVLFFCFCFIYCHQPIATTIDDDTFFIDISADPVQKPCKVDPIIRHISRGQLIISPVAEYRLAGVVKSKKNYSSGWESRVSPVDFAIVWGKLTLPEYNQYMSYSQRGRWYYYKYKGGFPASQKYIIQHSSNNHILPANDNIWAAAKSIKKEQEILLEGYLVQVKGLYKGNRVWWNSSLTRKDTGDHSCEIFYVKKIITNNQIYQ